MALISSASVKNFLSAPPHGQKPATIEQLRRFGWLVGGIFLLLFGLWLPHVHKTQKPIWAWVLGIVLIGTATVAPRRLRWVYGLWMHLGLILGAINTRIILVVLYYLSIVPIGVVLRLMDKDLLDVRFDKTCVTYRRARDAQDISKESMDDPF